jgi:cysteinyl-tRNA synthetase
MNSSTNTLWVIDYSKNGTEEEKFSKNEIKTFKGHSNIMISYFCLGEAEKARYYWDNLDQSLIINPNPSFPDNYIVKFWEKSWQDILVRDTATFGKSYLKRIIELGFDGVYLDTVDDFEIYTDAIERRLRAKQMAELVRNIHQAATALKPGFKIILQNATSFLYELDRPYEELLAYTDGFGIESLHYRGPNYENNSFNPDIWVMDEVKTLKNQYKQKIFNVEYIMGLPSEYEIYKQTAEKEGFVPLISKRSLDGNMIKNNQI